MARNPGNYHKLRFILPRPESHKNGIIIHPAYWSSDEMGHEHLEHEYLIQVGLPLPRLRVIFDGHRWANFHYAALCLYHKRCEYDLDSDGLVGKPAKLMFDTCQAWNGKPWISMAGDTTFICNWIYY